MQKKKAYKSLVICSIILGVLISLQLKTIDTENNGMTTSKRGEQLAVELRGLKKEESDLRAENKAIEDKINKYQGDQGDDKLEAEIAKYEMLAGYTNVSGKGIEVNINQNSGTKSNSSQSIIYNYDLILSMINKLNSAQANAISINRERVVSNTYIHLKGDSLFINDIKIDEPIIVKVIGDPDTLASALQIKYGIIWEMEKYYNCKIEIKKETKMDINGHSKLIDSSTDKR